MPDILYGDLAVHLEGMGENVWSAKMAEDIENFRIECKELFQELNIPAPNYEVVAGITALRKYLKTHEGVYVKISIIRGMCETFRSDSLKMSEGKLDRLARDLGPWKETQDFLVEEEVPDAVEISYDLYCIDGEYPQKTVFGVEIKSEAYFCKTMDYDQLPEQVIDYNAKIAPTLKKYRCRSNTPCELRVQKNGAYKAIDICMREGAPSFGAKLNLVINWPKIYSGGAQGKVVEPEFADKCAMELCLYSETAKTEALPIYFPPKYRNNIKLRYSCEIDGTCYVLPQPCPNGTLGTIAVTGSTWEECKGNIIEIRDELKAEGLESSLEAIDKTKTEWNKMQDHGISIPKIQESS
jgi:hypothetical protein